MRKKVDSRIRTLVENCVKTRQRSLYVIVGDKGRDQVCRTGWVCRGPSMFPEGWGGYLPILGGNAVDLSAPGFGAQVVNLHYMLSKTVVKARPSVLWCYKKDLYLSRCECPRSSCSWMQAPG